MRATFSTIYISHATMMVMMVKLKHLYSPPLSSLSFPCTEIACELPIWKFLHFNTRAERQQQQPFIKKGRGSAIFVYTIMDFEDG